MVEWGWGGTECAIKDCIHWHSSPFYVAKPKILTELRVTTIRHNGYQSSKQPGAAGETEFKRGKEEREIKNKTKKHYNSILSILEVQTYKLYTSCCKVENYVNGLALVA